MQQHIWHLREAVRMGGVGWVGLGRGWVYKKPINYLIKAMVQIIRIDRYDKELMRAGKESRGNI